MRTGVGVDGWAVGGIGVGTGEGVAVGSEVGVGIVEEVGIGVLVAVGVGSDTGLGVGVAAGVDPWQVRERAAATTIQGTTAFQSCKPNFTVTCLRLVMRVAKAIAAMGNVGPFGVVMADKFCARAPSTGPYRLPCNSSTSPSART